MDEELQGQPLLDEQEIKEGAPFAAISYVPFLWILTFLMKRQNQFALFHARQGIVISVGVFACFFLPLIPAIGFFLYRVGLLVFLVTILYGIYGALSGKMIRIPKVSDLADKLVI
ncbi:MAG: hypothetical protein GF333_02520 [Candidatus Omnitrophica bacterium]|nr:hypothetical protein [Candidatus Omnitrophota bacterium]